jgi:hypothetical protein
MNRFASAVLGEAGGKEKRARPFYNLMHLKSVIGGSTMTSRTALGPVTCRWL